MIQIEKHPVEFRPRNCDHAPITQAFFLEFCESSTMFIFGSCLNGSDFGLVQHS